MPQLRTKLPTRKGALPMLLVSSWRFNYPPPPERSTKKKKSEAWGFFKKKIMSKKKKDLMNKFITKMITDLGDELFPKNTEELVDTVLELYPFIKEQEKELDINLKNCN